MFSERITEELAEEKRIRVILTPDHVIPGLGCIDQSINGQNFHPSVRTREEFEYTPNIILHAIICDSARLTP